MRPPTAWITHADCLAHDTGAGHPESPGRLEALRKMIAELKSELAGRIIELEARHAGEEELLLAHPASHVRLIREVAQQAADGGTLLALDADTIVSPGSWTAAAAAAGSTLTAVDALLAGTAANAFCAVRPPGHHATADRAMGFCLFNNVAIGVMYARSRDLARALIVDWDVHHGNGTEAIFYADPDVFYLSMHQSPHYPGTGASADRGTGDGLGTTLNLPVAPGLAPERYVDELKAGMDQALDALEPDIIFISAGFDAAYGDPLAGLTLRPSDYHALTRYLMAIADRSCAGRIVSVLEGGYDLDELTRCAEAHLRALAA